MSKEAVSTMKLEPELRTEFMAVAEASHRPASQILRELIRDFVQRQREAREYDDFLRRKVRKREHKYRQASTNLMKMSPPNSLPSGRNCWPSLSRLTDEGSLV